MKDWTEILLKPNSSLETAIQVLQSGAMRVVLVVDRNRKLLGTVTDGDIRRALIKHVEMQCEVEKVMNSEPITALVSDSPDAVMFKMKKQDLLHIPLVDNEDTLVGLETLQHLLSVKRYDNPVFLMAGGFGTRLRPLTEKKPKPLLNVGGQPILETIIKRFIESGFHNFYISTHYKAEMIREHFGDGANWGIKIEYLHEDKPLGTAGSLGLLSDSIPDLPLIMMNSDLLTRVNFEHLLDFHHQEGGVATMCVREYDFQVPYGVVKGEGNKVTSIAEKPVQQLFINAGIYVIEPSLIDFVERYSYLDMPNLLEDAIQKKEGVSMFPIHEYWLDIGRMSEYKQAHEDYSMEFLND